MILANILQYFSDNFSFCIRKHVLMFNIPFFCSQIAASYGSTVCVFEPVQDPDQKDTSLTVSSPHYLPVTVWSCMYSEIETFLFQAS